MSLGALRKRIDEIDAELVRLLNERAGVAVEIGREKRSQGAPVVDAAREGQVLDRVCCLNRGPISAAALQSIYRAVVKECSRLQGED